MAIVSGAEMPLFLIANRWFGRVGRHRVLALVSTALGVVLIGAVLYSLAEHENFGISLYWAIVTATTVGYGDVTPHNTTGRIIACFVMLTTIPLVGAVFATVISDSAVKRMRRLLGMDSTLPNTPYTIVFGAHPVLARVIDELERSGDEVVLVAPARPAGLPDHFMLLAGDPTDEALIHKSVPQNANRALIACEQDADTLVIAVALHSIAPTLETFALTQSPRVAQALSDLGVTHTLAADELVGHTLAKSLETPQAGDVLLKLVDSTSYKLIESPVDAALVSKRLSEARGSRGTLVLGISRAGVVDLGLGDDPILTDDDRLIVVEPA